MKHLKIITLLFVGIFLINNAWADHTVCMKGDQKEAIHIKSTNAVTGADCRVVSKVGDTKTDLFGPGKDAAKCNLKVSEIVKQRTLDGWNCSNVMHQHSAKEQCCGECGGADKKADKKQCGADCSDCEKCDAKKKAVEDRQEIKELKAKEREAKKTEKEIRREAKEAKKEARKAKKQAKKAKKAERETARAKKAEERAVKAKAKAEKQTAKAEKQAAKAAEKIEEYTAE